MNTVSVSVTYVVEGGAVIVEIGVVFDLITTRDVVLVVKKLVGTLDGDAAPYPVLQSSCTVVVWADEEQARRATSRHVRTTEAIVNQTNVKAIQRNKRCEREGERKVNTSKMSLAAPTILDYRYQNTNVFHLFPGVAMD